jgi:hypothetical protein
LLRDFPSLSDVLRNRCQPLVIFAQAFDLHEEPVYALDFDYGEAPGMDACKYSIQYLTSICSIRYESVESRFAVARGDAPKCTDCYADLPRT